MTNRPALYRYIGRAPQSGFWLPTSALFSRMSHTGLGGFDVSDCQAECGSVAHPNRTIEGLCRIRAASPGTWSRSHEAGTGVRSVGGFDRECRGTLSTAHSET